ncbi:hypothetical protein ACG1BZ_07595 [Microbulbifer sp. CNSA002]|uniref:hypothetical protein n=1 Tax=unclassified Microbulbifer TaxID=2619833 RepID=UPI0039B48CA5
MQISTVGSSSQEGFALPAVLALTVAVGVVSAIAAENVTGSIRRLQEQELLFVGQQYRRAIKSYYLAAQNRQYPRKLEDLLQDSRFHRVRHIRKLYQDPITGDSMEVIRGPGGSIVGVRSRSQARPFRQANFRWEDRAFAGVGSHAEWEFRYAPEPAVSTGRN